MTQGTAQPEPVLSRATIVTVITVLAALLVKVGGGQVSTWLDQNADLIAAIILAVGPLVSAYLARRKVTPVASPKDDKGNKLTPAGS